MKKILFLCLLFLPLLGHSQGFFKPVDKSILFNKNDRGVSSTWLFRPVVQLSAMQINLGSPATVQSLNSLGTGVAYSHFSEVNGEPYQDIAVNLLVLFGTEIADSSPLELSIAVTGTFWQYLSIGGGYNVQDKKIFILTGISFNFN